LNKENCELTACRRKTSIGGQALIEGIMMRGPKKSAMAVRDPEGNIVLEKWDNTQPKHKGLYKTPVIRGVFNFISSMSAGYKSLMRSAEIAMPEDEAPKKKNEAEAVEDTETVDAAEALENAEMADDAKEETKEEIKEEKTEKKDKSKSNAVLMTVVTTVATVLGVGLSIVLFIVLPTFIFSWLSELLPFLEPKNAALASLIKSVFEGVLKIAILVGYMALVSLMKDIRRTFMYHGAEHKTIFCYENGLELTVENVKAQRRFHPRCGTSFLILMLIVGIFISFFIDPLFLLTTGDVPHVAIRAVIKLLLLPLMMGVGYELIKLAGRRQNLFTRIISAPGMWLQHITVLEPDDDMIECAIKAFVEVIPEDESDKI
jgi:uncharacterized protein YqhQ